VTTGISIDGEHDVLGLWAGPAGGGEGAKQWMSMRTELRNRGVADGCILCCDALKGLPDAIGDLASRHDQDVCGAFGALEPAYYT
jgi:putative transposase